MTASQLADEAARIAEAQPPIDVEEVTDHPVTKAEVDRYLEPAREVALIPRTDELQVLAQLAVTFAQAGLVPRPLQNKPADVLLVLMTGRGLGIDPLVALRECHPIDGKVTVSPKLKLAIVRQRGLGQVWPDPANDGEQATWHATRDDDPRGTVYSASYSMADASNAGLANKDNWTKYPRQMLQWRALGYLLDVAFGEVGTGLYSADELGAVTDDEGHAVIDVGEVAPLAGIEPPRKALTERAKRDRAAVGSRIVALDDMRKAAVREFLAAQSIPLVPLEWTDRQLNAVIEQVALAEAAQAAPDAAPGSPESAPTPDPATDGAEMALFPSGADEDPACSASDCGELAVILDDDENAWCEDHRPVVGQFQNRRPGDG